MVDGAALVDLLDDLRDNCAVAGAAALTTVLVEDAVTADASDSVADTVPLVAVEAAPVLLL